MRRLAPAALATAALSSLTGCAEPAPPAAAVVASGKSGHDHDHGHSHTRDTMMAADAGKYHAWLTAHLSSKDGNELDVFFETADDAPKPVALPVAKVTAEARRAGDDKVYELTFEPAPPDERPEGEAAGTCSHFVAKAPWMKADDVLAVTATVEIDGRTRNPKWIKFHPKKYAHHVD